MKKITLLAAALLVGAISFGQNTVIERIANTGGSALISTAGDDGTSVYCGDYFEITAETALGSILVNGLNSNDVQIEDELLGFNIFIYTDAGGVPSSSPEVPGTGVAEIAITDTALFSITEDGAGAADFAVPSITDANGGTQVVLQPGNYWMVAYPTVEGAPGGNARWNWWGSTETPAVEPVLIDPQDLFGAGATDWANISGLIGASFTAFAWTLVDEPVVLGTNDVELAGVAVFPNPATDIVNVKVPSNVELTGVSVYDVLGKKVNADVSDAQVNVSGLARGVYVINVETNVGTLTEKLIIE